MMYTTQFVDVQKSEELACPLGEYQNVMEAEYIVHVYQYLRLLGHAPHKITILTTYDEQVHLIRDIMNLRCVDSTHFGKPKDITTIDQYNGLENDIVLLSTVRTTAMPFDTMPDLVNAFSRARLGLYIFGHVVAHMLNSMNDVFHLMFSVHDMIFDIGNNVQIFVRFFFFFVVVQCFQTSVVFLVGGGWGGC